MNRPLAVLLAVAILTTQAAAQGDAAKVLTGVEKTKHFEIHFRPDSHAEASIDRVVAMVETDLAMILKELALPDFPHVIKLFVYDDVAELQKITKTGAEGFSIPLESHVPRDNDQTRVHELVHVVAEKFTERGPETRNLFFAEGLANAVLRYVHGVHVDAVAAFYKKRGQLPSLTELNGLNDFYAWLASHPGVNGYDIGGSYMRFLLDTYGAPKTRGYYRGVPAKEAFGADLAAIEKAWHARLEKVRLRPGLVSLLEERADGPSAALKKSPEAKLTDAILGPASQWKSLDRVAIPAGDPGAWDPKATARPTLVLTGEKSQGDWCIARTGADAVADAIVRTTLAADDGCYGVQLQIGPKCQALLLKGQGLFLYSDATAVGVNPAITLGEAPVEIVLRRRGGKASVWINGALGVEGAIDPAPAPIGVGCVGGRAKATGISVRRM